jgi:hypothetical protein
VSGRLVGRVLRSRLGAGGNERLLLVAVAEELHDNRPAAFVTLGVRTLADRLECDHATVPDVVKRAERLGVLKVKRPGRNRRWSYRIRWRLLAMDPKQRPKPAEETVGTVPTVAGPRSVGIAPTDGGRPGADPSVGTVPTEVLAPRQHDPVRNPSHPGADGERAPRQRPALSVVGDEPPSPTPPRARSDPRAAADGPARTPATAAATGRAPPSLQAASVGLLTLDPTQGDEMAPDGETHEQTTLTADRGPGPQGEEHGAEPPRAEAAVLVGAVAGSTDGHPDGGDRGRALYRGGGGVPWDDEPVTVERHLGLDAVLVVVPCPVCGGRGWHTAGGGDPTACGACPAGEAWHGGPDSEEEEAAA